MDLSWHSTSLKEMLSVLRGLTMAMSTLNGLYKTRYFLDIPRVKPSPEILDRLDAMLSLCELDPSEIPDYVKEVWAAARQIYPSSPKKTNNVA